ncbi:hypothetical protein CONLIGDRAFT_649895 [Coniochaeta ligniaria NRRL 30616]|uniref:DUF7924 domain-containing protein n=1 Tax=Coniochaeta ligniaria NRRL 30616 TaxID=1408157 RepID=A0A1J7J0I8_9PEZI|nr:hypothetical protein CONLIGDRAFT_649895 [Coniochaeta ligniaria NRRL 30616]
MGRIASCVGNKDGYMASEFPDVPALIYRRCGEDVNIVKEYPNPEIWKNCGEEVSQDSEYIHGAASGCKFAHKVDRSQFLDTTTKAAWEIIVHLWEGVARPYPSLFDDDIVEALATTSTLGTGLIVPSTETSLLRADKTNVLQPSRRKPGRQPPPARLLVDRHDAFIADQLDRMPSYMGSFLAGEQTLFIVAPYMHFPFLACEAESGPAGNNVAGRQNTDSMTLAVHPLSRPWVL